MREMNSMQAKLWVYFEDFFYIYSLVEAMMYSRQSGMFYFKVHELADVFFHQ